MKRSEPFGKATYCKGRLYFDDAGWAMVKACARKAHRTPQQVVTAALWRMVRNAKKIQWK